MNLKATGLILFLGTMLITRVDVHAQCDSINTTVTNKIRFLGGWQSNGRPTYLTNADAISQEIKDFVNATLPESTRNSDSAYFDDNVQSNTILVDTTDLYLTFLQENASWRNTLGFYTYDVDEPPTTFEDIDSLVIVFPNIDTANVLNVGDKVKLGTFLPGTGIGYFLMTKGWVGDTICLNSHIIFTDKRLNTFTDEENQQHTVLLHYEEGEMLLLGIEDQSRPTGDQDFNDAVFYITAEDFKAVDTTDIPKIPVAEIFGDTVLCSDEATAKITIEISGEPPFNLVYNDGTKDISVENINANVYTFEAAVRDTFTLVSVENADGQGILKGQAVVRQSGINAHWTPDELGVCDGATTTTAEVTLEGIAPFKLVYEEDGVEKSVDNITETTYEIPVSVGGGYMLTEIHDAYCSTTLEEDLSFEIFDVPTASIEDVDTTLCAGTAFALELDFSGTAPYTFIYSKNGVNDTLVANDPHYELAVTESANIIPLKVIDTHCESLSVSGSAEITFIELPAVSIDAAGNTTCGDNAALIDLSFTGTAPWAFKVKNGENIALHTSSSDNYQLQLLEGGDYELFNLADAQCANPATKAFEVIEFTPPTAVISGNGAICKGAEASLLVTLTGTAPFTFTYTDGENDYPITTSETTYAIETSVLGAYSIKNVSDANCEGTTEGEIIVQNKVQPVVSFSGENILCEGGKARLAFNFTGTAPFSFTLTNGAAETVYSVDENEFEVFVSEPGTYELTGFSDANCSGESTEVVIVNLAKKPSAAISLVENGEICGDEKAKVTIDLAGTAPFYITYTNGREEFSVETNENRYVFETSVAGVYQVTALADAYCSGEGSEKIEIIDKAAALNGEITGNAQVCEGDQVVLGFDGSTDIVSHSWATSGSGALETTSLNEATYTPADGETGFITFSLDVANDCGAKTFTKEVEITAMPEARFSTFPGELLSDTEITFTAGIENYDQYTWDFGDGNSGSGNLATHVYDAPGEYEITLTVGHKGCPGAGSQPVVVKTKNDLYVPNVFSPDASHPENRVVKVYGTNISEEGFSFKILNRWGNLMYQTNSFLLANSQGWDGREFHNEEMQSLSAFTYILKGKFLDGETFEKTGTITIIQ